MAKTRAKLPQGCPIEHRVSGRVSCLNQLLAFFWLGFDPCNFFVGNTSPMTPPSNVIEQNAQPFPGAGVILWRRCRKGQLIPPARLRLEVEDRRGRVPGPSLMEQPTVHMGMTIAFPLL